MKFGVRCLGLLVCLAGVLVPPVSAQEPGGTKIGLGFGLLLSSGYNSTLDDWAEAQGAEVSGGWGWLDLGLNAEIPLGSGFSVVPECDLLMNFVAGTGELDGGMNLIVLPSVSARYRVSGEAGLYLQLGINYGIVNMGLEGWEEIEADGIGIQALVGYAFAGSSLALEGGYTQIPVSVDESDWDEDFGGVQLRGAVSF